MLFSLSQQAAYKQKVPPWYAVLWEAWRILVLQKYGFYLIPPIIFFKICLPNMDFNPSLILNIFFHQFLWPLQLLTS